MCVSVSGISSPKIASIVPYDNQNKSLHSAWVERVGEWPKHHAPASHLPVLVCHDLRVAIEEQEQAVDESPVQVIEGE